MKINRKFLFRNKGRLLLKLFLIMKLTWLLTIVFTFNVSASVWSQTSKLDIEVNNSTLQELFSKIENNSNYRFFYNNDDVDISQRVSVKLTDKSIGDILTEIFTELPYSFKELNDNLILIERIKKEEAYNTKSLQMTQVKGTVTDVDGLPLPGVSVSIKGTTKGTVTDVDGNYVIENISSEAILVFSFVGMRSQEIPFDGKTTISITMEEETIGLDEVVAIGYGTMKKSDLTGAISAVSQDDYKEQAVTRVDQILQGRSAGVNVVSSSGAPGGEISIRIRGANSINGSNDPLYVIDGFVGADFKDVNPSDIESMQVLKDASSTAIYGSRGANGVVLITTRGGFSGKAKFSVTARGFVSKVLKTWDLMDAVEFATVANERAIAVGTTPPFSDDEIVWYRNNGGTDWQDEILRTGKGQEYQLDYSGGNDKLTYFISGNYYSQDGIIINSNYKRYSLRTNVNATINDKIRANLKMNFARRENNNTEGNTNSTSVLSAATAWSPTTPVRDENGILTLTDPSSTVIDNPLELAQNDNIRENNAFNANGGFIFEPLGGLSIDISFGINYSNTQRKDYDASSIMDSPSSGRGSTERIFLQNTNTLTYTKTINDIHRFTATGVIEHQLLQSDAFSVTAGNLQFPDLRYDNITLAEMLTAEAQKSKETIRSFIGRLNYSLKDKYLLTLSVRSDGSSKFRGNNRYSIFPSVGLGWRLSEEPFVKDLDFLDNLKFRASWGKTGSQAIPVYGTVTSFNTSMSDAGSSFEPGKMSAGLIIGNPGNENLKWETTEQINAGFDLGFFNNRLNAEIDYFVKNTKDLLLSMPLPNYAGGGSIYKNLGKVKNNGFEFSLKGNIINNKNGFNWSTAFNASFLKNEVKDIGDQTQIFIDGDVGKGNTNLPEGIIIPGYGLSNYYGLKYLGVWQLDEATEAAKYGNIPGDSKYEDVNHDYAIGGDDFQIIGSGIPSRMFGWNNIFQYKAFTLNIFLQAIAGFDKWNFTYAQSVMASTDAREITHSDILQRWSPDNQGSNIPAFSATDVSEFQSSRFVEKGDFIRLKNLSLSYDLPKDFIQGINGSVTLSGSNLLTITKYKGIDPESHSNIGLSDSRGIDAGSYPNSKTWTLGINLIF